MVAPAPRTLLGRIPGTSQYRVIACSLGPEKRDAGAKELEAHAGERVSFADGSSAKIAAVVEVVTGDGSKGKAFELDSVGGLVAVFPADAAKLVLDTASLERADIDTLKQGTRALSPLAKWATSWSFEARAFDVRLDANDQRDRIAVGRVEDKGPKGSRQLHGVWVSRDRKPFELVQWSVEPIEPLGAVDLDADGRDEILFVVNGPMEGAYDYTLRRVVEGVQPSEAWQLFDRLEDHDHSDE